MPTPSDGTLADRALARGVVYAALALGFGPPSRETIERLADSEAAEALADAARRFQEPASDLVACVRALRRPIALDELAATYRRLFGHTARGEVPPYETEYGAEALFQQPQELGDLSGFARAFGLVLRSETRERIDHVSCECELASFFAWKEAYALETGEREMHAATVRATTLFLRDHLGRFAPVFTRRLVRADADGFYGGLGRLLGRMVAIDCDRLQVAMGSETLGLRPDPAACSAPMGCASSCGVSPDGP
jgi:DMSO reductase family type II enzyme chaperone